MVQVKKHLSRCKTLTSCRTLELRLWRPIEQAGWIQRPVVIKVMTGYTAWHGNEIAARDTGAYIGMLRRRRRSPVGRASLACVPQDGTFVLRRAKKLPRLS